MFIFLPVSVILKPGPSNMLRDMCEQACTHDILKLGQYVNSNAIGLPMHKVAFQKFSLGPVCFDNVKVVLILELFYGILAQADLISVATSEKKS